MENNTINSKKNIVPLRNKIGYSFGNLGYGVIFQIIASYLIFYATAILKLSGSLVGIAISISVIWDSVSDPIMGHISDKTKMKYFGRRHFYILIGTVFVALLNLTIWNINPEFSNSVKFYMLLANILLIKTFFTIYFTPYSALGAELSSDYNERTSIQSIKTIFFLLGLLFSSAIVLVLFFKPTEQYPVGQLNPASYTSMAICTSIMMLVFGLMCFFSTIKYKSHPSFSPDDITSKFNLKSSFIDFISVLKHRNYRVIVIGYLLTNISSALIGTIGLHIYTYTFLMSSNEIAIIAGTLLLVCVVTQPIWVMITKKIDKKPSVILGLSISLVACVVFIFFVIGKDFVRDNYLVLLLFSLLIGFGTAGLFSIPLSMVADTTDEDELNNGLRREGVYFGSLTFGYKLSQSIAILVLGIVLDTINFDANIAVQTNHVSTTLGLILPIGSIISFALAIFVYRGYSLSRKDVEDIQSKIQKNIDNKVEA